jgi:catechol 2,3-dioxygenase-like lactoylglutathione lyase family enzyme
MNPDTLYSESQITLVVPDLDQAVRFYTEALGLRLKARYGKEFSVRTKRMALTAVLPQPLPHKSSIANSEQRPAASRCQGY